MVAKVEFHPGQLFPTVGFIVTKPKLGLIEPRACEPTVRLKKI